MRISPYLAEVIFNVISGGYIALHSSSPDADDPTLSEITGGGYERIPGTLTMAGPRTVTNQQPIVFPNLPPVVVSHIAVWDAEKSGNLLMSVQLDDAKRISDSARYTIPALDFVVSL